MTYIDSFATVSATGIATISDLNVSENLTLTDLNSTFLRNQANPGYGLLSINGAVDSDFDPDFNTKPSQEYPNDFNLVNYSEEGVLKNYPTFKAHPQGGFTTPYSAIADGTNFIVSGTGGVPGISTNDFIEISSDPGVLYYITNIVVDNPNNQTIISTYPNALGSGSIILTEGVTAENVAVGHLSNCKFDTTTTKIVAPNILLPPANYSTFYNSVSQPATEYDPFVRVAFANTDLTSGNFFVPHPSNQYATANTLFYWPVPAGQTDNNNYIISVTFSVVWNYRNDNGGDTNSYTYVAKHDISSGSGPYPELDRLAQYNGTQLEGDYPFSTGCAIVTNFNRNNHGIEIGNTFFFESYKQVDDYGIGYQAWMGDSTYTNLTRLEIGLVGVM